MTPFLQVRLWWKRAAYAQKAATAATLAVVVALAGWFLVPTGNGSGSAEQAANVVAGSPAEGVATTSTTTITGAAPAPSASAAPTATTIAAGTSGGVAAVGGAAGAACPQVPAGTPGVDAKTVTIAAVVLELAGPIGNSASGLASPDELKRMAQATADDVNAHGGVACRKIVLRYYNANPLNQDQQHAVCLQIAQDKPFLAIDLAGFAYPPDIAGCLPQQHVPFVSVNFLLPSAMQQFRPYLATSSGDMLAAMHTGVLALKARGWFDPAKGFKKLGILEEDCTPEATRAFDADLAEIGIAKNQISKFVFPCPTGGFAPPNQMSQAVAQHRLDGVTSVIPLTGSGSFDTYTNIAQGQGFRPAYGLTEYGNMIVTQAGSLKANADNFDDNNTTITLTKYGMNTTPGIAPDATTLRCQSILVKAGFAPDDVYQRGGGIMCSQVWVATAAIAHARTLTRETALPALFDAGTVPLPFPLTDASYRPPAKFHGGDTWWPVQYQRACECWRVLDPHRQPVS